MKLNTALRSARAQAIVSALDATPVPGFLQLWAGGSPPLSAELTSLSEYATSAAYAVDDLVTAGLHYYQAIQSGTSGSTAPSWPTDGSSVPDNGVVWQDLGVIPVLLGTLTLSQPCGTVTEGVLTFAAIADDDAADNNGTASFARLCDGEGMVVIQGSVGSQGSGAFIEMNTTSVIAGGPLRITLATLTEGG